MSREPGARMRGRRGRSAAAALVLLGCASLASRAADANVLPYYFDGGAGGALVPRSTDEVRIVSEHLELVEGMEVFAPTEPGVYAWLPWHVRADYVLENLTEERVELDVGFPFAGQRGHNDLEFEAEEDIVSRGWIASRGTRPFDRSFHARLEGSDLQHQRVRNRCPSQRGDDEAGKTSYCYPYVFVFRVALEARAQVSLTVEYDQDPSARGELDYYVEASVDYILETGALWAGTMGNLEIVYRFAIPPYPHYSNRDRTGVVFYGKLIGTEAAHPPPANSSVLQTELPRWLEGKPPPAPAGVLDLWDPAVRFEYALGCEESGIVLRLRAADFEPGGNISIGVPALDFRLEVLRDDSSCLLSRERVFGSGDPWGPWEDLTAGPGDPPAAVGGTLEPPPEWTCSLTRPERDFQRVGAPTMERDYRWDCCCAAAVARLPWYPRAGVNDMDGGDAGARPDAPEADAVGASEVVVEQDAADGGGEEAAPDATATATLSIDAQAASEEPEAAAAPAPPAVTPAETDDAAAPAAPRPKSGCGCRVVDGGASAWCGLAAFGGLLFLRLRRRHSTRIDGAAPAQRGGRSDPAAAAEG